MKWHVPVKRNERSGRTIGCPAVSRFLGLTNYLVLGIVASALAIGMPVYFAPDSGWLVAKPAFAAGNGGGSGGNGGGGSGGGSGGGDSGNSGNGGGNAGGAGGAGGGDGNNGNNGNNNNNGNNGNGNAGGAGGGDDDTGGDDGTAGDDGDTSGDGDPSDVSDDGASPPRQWLDDMLDAMTDEDLEAYVLYGDGASEAPAGASAIARAAVLDRDEEAQMIGAGWTALN